MPDRTQQTKASLRQTARGLLARGTYACTDTGNASPTGWNRKVMYDGEWIVLYGSMGRPPSHSEMVRQLSERLGDRLENLGHHNPFRVS